MDYKLIEEASIKKAKEQPGRKDHLLDVRIVAREAIRLSHLAGLVDARDAKVKKGILPYGLSSAWKAGVKDKERAIHALIGEEPLPDAPLPRERLVIIGSGFRDQVITHLRMIPEGMDIDAEKAAWGEWYQKTYVPALRSKPIKYITFADWLLTRGARLPTTEEVTTFEGD